MNASFSLPRKLLAWAVHLLTASSAVFGFLALVALMEREWRLALLWMAAATVIDSVDGGLSRRLQVKQVLPDFDGGLLDNIVDYLTYVVVSAVFVYQAELVPAGWLLVMPALMLLTSGYQFSQADAKTDDHFFKGFPSYWNVVVIYLWLLHLPPLLNLLLLLLCAVMVFVPVKYIYPSRMPRYRRLTAVLGWVWALLLLLVLFRFPPAVAGNWAQLSLLYVAYYVGLSLFFMWQERRE